MASACDSRGNFDVVAVKWEVPAAGVDVRGILIQEVRQGSLAAKTSSHVITKFFARASRPPLLPECAS